MNTITKILAGIFGMMILLISQNVQAQVQSPNVVYIIAKEYGSNKTIITYPFGGNCSKMFYGKTNIINEYKEKYGKRNNGKTLISVEIKGPYSSHEEAQKAYYKDLDKLVESSISSFP